jgi:hypothetical protein
MLWNIAKWILEQAQALVIWVLAGVAALGEAVLHSALDGLALFLDATYVQQFAEVLAQADYIMPIRETVGFGTSMFTLWVSVLVYRIVKSYLPTISGT